MAACAGRDTALSVNKPHKEVFMKKYKANIILLAFRGSPLPAVLVEVEALTPADVPDEVYKMAQNIHESWIEDPRVLAVYKTGTTEPLIRACWPAGLRSLSVDDRVEVIGVGTWECKPLGWKFLPKH